MDPCPQSQQSYTWAAECPGDPLALAGSFGANGQHLALVTKMEVPCDLRSVSVCSSDRATQRKREPGSCHWFVQGTQAPLDARRGWDRCTSPERAGHGGVMATTGDFCLPWSPCSSSFWVKGRALPGTSSDVLTQGRNVDYYFPKAWGHQLTDAPA